MPSLRERPTRATSLATVALERVQQMPSFYQFDPAPSPPLQFHSRAFSKGSRSDHAPLVQVEISQSPLSFVIGRWGSIERTERTASLQLSAVSTAFRPTKAKNHSLLDPPVSATQDRGGFFFFFPPLIGVSEWLGVSKSLSENQFPLGEPTKDFLLCNHRSVANYSRGRTSLPRTSQSLSITPNTC